MRWIEVARLAEALELSDHEHVALVGGGGKTTALFALGRQLPGRVILTTTTKMGRDRTGGFTPLLGADDLAIDTALDNDGAALVWTDGDGHRAVGLDSADCDQWFARVDHVVVEADGSRRRPFKAPAVHEPVVPSSTTHLVACVGASAFGARIADACHRPELVAALVDGTVDDYLDPASVAAVLTHRSGSMKSRPARARATALVNQADAERHGDFVTELAHRLAGELPVVAIRPFDPADSPELTRTGR